MVFECNASNLELLAVVIEGRGKRVEEAGDHVHSKTILSRASEPGYSIGQKSDVNINKPVIFVKQQ